MTTQEDSWNEDEGARPSSLLSVHKLSSRDIHYDSQLLRDLEIANARTRVELGHLPPDGVPVAVKRKPSIPKAAGSHGDAARVTGAATPSPGDSETQMAYDPQEAEIMKLQSVAMAAAIGAVTLAGGLANASSHDSIPAKARTATSHRIPEYFHLYSTTPVGDNSKCVAGKVTDEDGMFSRPYVYVADAAGERIKWARYMDMPDDFYEGRATHCVRRGDALYVLLQLDTQAPRSLSQTLLSIVKVRIADGSTEGEEDVPVPNAKGPYTSWVWDDDGLKVVNDAFLVTGKYRYLDTEDDFPFSVKIKM
jgi:hypothetical protein